MIILTGYKIDTQDYKTIELLLNEIQQAVLKRAKEEYHQLLCREIENMVDDIVLNVYNRPEGSTILEAAQSIINQRVAYATGKNLPTAYNLYLAAHVMFADESSYIRLVGNNNIYHKQISAINGLQPFSLESDSSDERCRVWEKIMEKYEKGVQPFAVNIHPCGQIEVQKKMLKFRSPVKRAEIRARHTLQNRYLSMYANEAEIPNYKLMEYMDHALEAVASRQACKTELHRMKQELQAILPNITYSMISESGSTDAGKQKETDTGEIKDVLEQQEG